MVPILVMSTDMAPPCHPPPPPPPPPPPVSAVQRRSSSPPPRPAHAARPIPSEVKYPIPETKPANQQGAEAQEQGGHYQTQYDDNCDEVSHPVQETQPAPEAE